MLQKIRMLVHCNFDFICYLQCVNIVESIVFLFFCKHIYNVYITISVGII